MLKHSRKSGFTLLELLIVVIIVSILAAVALPRFGGMQRRARTAEAVNMVGAIATAEYLQFQENGAFVASAGDNAFPAAMGVDVPGDANSNFDYTADGANPCIVTATGDAGGMQAQGGGLAVTVVCTVRADGSRTIVTNNL